MADEYERLAEKTELSYEEALALKEASMSTSTWQPGRFRYLASRCHSFSTFTRRSR
jgi:hypothetical protein